MNDISHIPIRDRGQLPALLLQHYGKDSIEKFIDDILDQGVISERKHTTFRRMFFLEDKPMSRTSFARKEPAVISTPLKLTPAVAKAKPRVKIPSQARKVPPVKRSLMYRIRKKLSKFLQP